MRSRMKYQIRNPEKIGALHLLYECIQGFFVKTVVG
jgi:hypothetical protein